MSVPEYGRFSSFIASDSSSITRTPIAVQLECSFFIGESFDFARVSRGGGFAEFFPHASNPPRQFGNCRGLEYPPQRQLDLQQPGQAGDYLGSQQGMTTQLEEVVVNADLLPL